MRKRFFVPYCICLAAFFIYVLAGGLSQEEDRLSGEVSYVGEQ